MNEVFVFTGTLDCFTRKQAQQLVLALGSNFLLNDFKVIHAINSFLFIVIVICLIIFLTSSFYFLSIYLQIRTFCNR